MHTAHSSERNMCLCDEIPFTTVARLMFRQFFMFLDQSDCLYIYHIVFGKSNYESFIIIIIIIIILIQTIHFNYIFNCKLFRLLQN